jgi:hypothetical protein
METTTGRNAGDATSSPDMLGRTADSAHEAVDKLAQAAAPVIDRLAAGAHQAVDRIVSSALPAADWFEESAHRVNESGVKMLADAKQHIRDNPLIALGAAIMAGVLLSELMRDRRH